MRRFLGQNLTLAVPPSSESASVSQTPGASSPSESFATRALQSLSLERYRSTASASDNNKGKRDGIGNGNGNGNGNASDAAALVLPAVAVEDNGTAIADGPPTIPRKDSATYNGTGTDEAWAAVKLPFASSDSSASSAGATGTDSPAGAQSNVNDAQDQPAQQPREAFPPSLRLSSLVNFKDQLTMDLLSSDALVHAEQLEILGFEEVEELRREHTLLATRLAMLQNKLAVESKIREASLAIARLYAPDGKSKRLSRQASEQLDTANRRVDAARNDVNRVGAREAEVRTRILAHMAGALACALRRAEHSAHAHAHHAGISSGRTTPTTAVSAYFSPRIKNAALPPLPPSLGGSTTSARSHPTSANLLSPRSAYSATFSPAASTSSSSAASRIGNGMFAASITPFEGPHLFAGNKDAVLPFAPARLSPSLHQGASFSLDRDIERDASSLTQSTRLPYSASPLINSTSSSHSQAQAHGVQTAALEEAHLAIERLEAEKEELQALLTGYRGRENEDTQKVRVEERRVAEDRARLAALTQEVSERDARLRQLEAEREAERRDLLSALQDTLQRHRLPERNSGTAHLGALLPSPQATIHLSTFVSSQLPAFLCSADEEHSRVLGKYTALQKQLGERDRAASASSAQAQEKEALASRRAVEMLTQEKQVLLKSIARSEAACAALEARASGLEEQLEQSAALAQEQAAHAERALQEAQNCFSDRLQETERRNQHDADGERRSLRARLENLQRDLAGVREERRSLGDKLQTLWARLPDEEALAARNALSDRDELSAYKAAFGVGSAPSAATTFSLDRFVPRLDAALNGTDKLYARLLVQEEHTLAHKAGTERAQKLLQESRGSLEVYAGQVRELSARLEAGSAKEVQLRDGLASAQGQADRLDAEKAELERKCNALMEEKSTLEKRFAAISASNASQEKDAQARRSLETQLEEAREELVAAQDELDELRSKESRQRVQMLDELTSLSEEASSLRTQLRAAQRKLATAGKA